MGNIVELDFTNAPPAQGGPLADRIPPGFYALRIEKAEKTQASTGRSMIVTTLRVATGEMVNKRLVERFVLPTGADDSRFGLQRFHQLLVSLGFKEQSARVKLDLTKLQGRNCVAEVDDEEVPASGQWPARIQSRPMAYYATNSAEATALAEVREQVQAGAEPAKPAPAPAPPAPAEAAGPAEAAPEVAEPMEPVPAEPAEAAPAAEAVSSSLDDLFE